MSNDTPAPYPMDEYHTPKTVAELEAELNEARQREHAASRVKYNATHPVYKFTLEPVVEQWDKLYDPTCRLYKLTGTVTNKEELKAVGKTPFQGSANLLFNGATQSFVCYVGGGSIYLNTQEGYDALSDFVVGVNGPSHPDGGDVTEIVTRHRETKSW